MRLPLCRRVGRALAGLLVRILAAIVVIAGPAMARVIARPAIFVVAPAVAGITRIGHESGSSEAIRVQTPSGPILEISETAVETDVRSGHDTGGAIAAPPVLLAVVRL